MIKALKKLGIEGMFLNIIKAIYDKSITNIILNAEQQKQCPLMSGMRQGCLLSPLLFNIAFGIPRHNNKTREKNKSN
jgi:hypothetical protein